MFSKIHELRRVLFKKCDLGSPQHEELYEKVVALGRLRTSKDFKKRQLGKVEREEQELHLQVI